MRVRSLLVRADGRPRAIWRIVIFVAVAGLLAAGVVPLVTAVLEPIVGHRESSITAGMCVALLLAHWVVLRWVERRGWETVGLDRAAARPAALGGGALLGATAIAAPVLLLWALGWMRLQTAPDGSSLVQAGRVALLLLPAALAEELVLRGYVFGVLREGIGPTGALALTSVLFGLLHVANPGATGLAIAMVTLAGMFLGAVLLATRSLYAAWMAHFAWNFVLAAVFHVAVSGLGFVTPDYRLVDAGPDWATGGPWGPEGGLAAGLAMSVALFYLIARPGRRGES